MLNCIVYCASFNLKIKEDLLHKRHQYNFKGQPIWVKENSYFLPAFRFKLMPMEKNMNPSLLHVWVDGRFNWAL